MSWVDMLLFLAALIGLAAGGFMIARSPAFWVGMGKELLKELLPVLTKRMTPDQEQAWRDCNRRNGTWNQRKKRCE